MGFCCPPALAPAIVEKTHSGLAQVLGRESIRNQLENVGASANLSTPEQFKKLIESEVVRWREVAKAAGLEPS